MFILKHAYFFGYRHISIVVCEHACLSSMLVFFPPCYNNVFMPISSFPCTLISPPGPINRMQIPSPLRSLSLTTTSLVGLIMVCHNLLLPSSDLYIVWGQGTISLVHPCWSTAVLVLVVQEYLLFLTACSIGLSWKRKPWMCMSS